MRTFGEMSFSFGKKIRSNTDTEIGPWFWFPIPKPNFGLTLGVNSLWGWFLEKSGFGAALKIHILATYKFTIASFLEEVAIMMSENVWMQHKFLGRKRRKKCNAKGRFFSLEKKKLFACHFTWIGPVFTFLFCLDFAKEVL